MDSQKANSLHRYAVIVRSIADCHRKRINVTIGQSMGHVRLGLDALNNGCDDCELSAIEAVMGADWAPEWAKERYTK